MDEKAVTAILAYDSSHLHVPAPSVLAGRARRARRRRRAGVASTALAAVGAAAAAWAVPAGPADSLTGVAAPPEGTVTAPAAEPDPSDGTEAAAGACRRELADRGIEVPSDQAVRVQPQPGGWLVQVPGPAGRPDARGWECDVELAVGEGPRDGTAAAVVNGVREPEPSRPLSLDGHGTVACRAAEIGLVTAKQPGDRSQEQVRQAVADSVATVRAQAGMSDSEGIDEAARALESGPSELAGFYRYCLQHGWGGNESLAR